MFSLKGKIVTQKRVQYKRQECYGITQAWGNQFLIKISLQTFKTADLFAETLLHELMHLWFFVLFSILKVRISERNQHKVIHALVGKACRMSAKYLNKAKRR